MPKLDSKPTTTTLPSTSHKTVYDDKHAVIDPRRFMQEHLYEKNNEFDAKDNDKIAVPDNKKTTRIYYYGKPTCLTSVNTKKHPAF